MTDNQINTCEFFNICEAACGGTLEDTEMCHCYELYKQLARKEKECQEAMDNYIQLDLQRVKEYNKLVDLYKAKEQECERLKADLKSLEYTVVLQGNRDIDNATDLFAKRIAKIENENSILKAELEQEKTLKEMYFTYYKAKHGDIKGKLFRYKQALTEIKEIAEKVYNDCDNCYRDTDTNCKVDCIDCTLGGKAKLAEQILRKISECEVQI